MGSVLEVQRQWIDEHPDEMESCALCRHFIGNAEYRRLENGQLVHTDCDGYQDNGAEFGHG